MTTPAEQVARTLGPFLPSRIGVTVASKMIIWMYALYGVGQGVGICLGGLVRWSGPSYSAIRQLPGSPYTWGVWIAAAGVLLLAASLLKHFWLKAAAIGLFVIWSVAFSVGAFIGTITVREAGTTGGPTYLLVAVVVAVLIIVDERRPRDQQQS